MSDISISDTTISSMAIENQASGADWLQETASSTVLSGISPDGPDSQEQAVAGLEVASRTSEFFGSGTDFSSTGTDIDVAQAINTTLLSGQGSITNKIV